MMNIRKTAKFLTLLIPNKKKRKLSSQKVENFLHKLFNTEHYRCEQIYQKVCNNNKSIGFDKYHLISLGYNCFGRMTFNYWGLKPRKADGERTMPFDISIHPLDSVISIIENNFSDYLDDIEYREQDNYWINKKYNIFFVHDHENDRKTFEERYKARITSFCDAIKDDVPTMFFCYTDKKADAKEINQLNNVLSKICTHKKYKLIYMIFNNHIPAGIDNNIATYQANYPQEYAHMDINSKYKYSGLNFEKGIVDFTYDELIKLLDNKKA